MPTINTNLEALKAQNALVVNDRQIQKAVAQLSTGRRVTTASDDAAGMSIGNSMQARIVSLNQAVRNANDGISMIQTADAALQGVSNVLYRMNELAIQSANGTMGASDRNALNLEFTELKNAMSSTIQGTTWNGMGLLNGTISTANYQAGVNGSVNDSVSVTYDNFSTLAAVTTAGIDTSANITTALTDIQNSLDTVNTTRSRWGASMNRLTHSADNASNVSMNLNQSQSRLVDADYAKATANLARAQILEQAGNAMLSQANQQPNLVLYLLN
jgi:flagellin